MKIYNFINSKIVLAAILAIFCHINCAQATIAYEESTNNMIDTVEDFYDGQNSFENDFLVGQDIQYYDFEAKQYKNAFVTFQDNTVSGIRLEVEEVETGKERVFIIEY